MAKTELHEIKKGQTGKGYLIENDGYISMESGDNKRLVEEFNASEEWHCPYPFIVSAVLQKHSKLNANGRIYPKAVLEREAEKYQQRIKEHRALGELNHPESATIDLGRISHNIIEMHWEGMTLVGKLELNLSQGFIKYGICSTMGDTCANLLLNGYKIGVSSRAVGSVENKMGQMIVGDDLELQCWDIVSDPSTNGSWIGDSLDELSPYIESKEHKGSVIQEKVDKIKKLLN